MCARLTFCPLCNQRFMQRHAGPLHLNVDDISTADCARNEDVLHPVPKNVQPVEKSAEKSASIRQGITIFPKKTFACLLVPKSLHYY